MKLQQAWQKYKQAGGKLSHSLRNELEQIFTQEQRQSISTIRDKCRQELGESFFQNNKANGYQGGNEQGYGDNDEQDVDQRGEAQNLAGGDYEGNGGNGRADNYGDRLGDDHEYRNCQAQKLNAKLYALNYQIIKQVCIV